MAQGKCLSSQKYTQTPFCDRKDKAYVEIVENLLSIINVLISSTGTVPSDSPDIINKFLAFFTLETDKND